MKLREPTAAQKAEYQRLIAITESRSTPFAEYQRAMQDLHNLMMQGFR